MSRCMGLEPLATRTTDGIVGSRKCHWSFDRGTLIWYDSCTINDMLSTKLDRYSKRQMVCKYDLYTFIPIANARVYAAIL